MKNTYQCPKCNSVDVLKVEGSRFNQTHVIGLAKWGATNAVLDRYLCTQCGYTEEWIQMNEKFRKWANKNRDKDSYRNDYV